MALDDIFRALGDPTRRKILRLLRRRDMAAGEIASQFPLAASTLSGHFNVLKHSGLIVADRRGTTILYSLNVSAAEEAMAAFMDIFHVGELRREKKR